MIPNTKIRHSSHKYIHLINTGRTNSLLSEVMTPVENDEEGNDLRCNVATMNLQN